MPAGKRRNPRPARSTHDDPGRVRIQKIMAAAGIGSRRACEALIEEGRVAVNGRVVRQLPVLITPGLDKIVIDGEPLERYMPKALRQAYGATRDPVGKPLVYVMLYKPRATLTTMLDPDQRRTVADIVQHPSGIRLYPVGRLDYDTLGLILLTNDGDLANRLTHPSFGVPKTYRAVVKGRLKPEQIEQLQSGAYLADRKAGRTVGASRTTGVNLSIVKSEPARTILDITLKEGRNRQVRRVLAKVGCPVRKLVRIAMGPLMLKGIKPGQWRDLTPREVRELQRAAVGEGPLAPDPRALNRSHAMKLGRNREHSNRVREGAAPSHPHPRERDTAAAPRRSKPPAPATAGTPVRRKQPPARPASSFPLADPPPRLRT